MIKGWEKSSLSDLALFGGQPAFSEPLHVGRPNIGNREGLLQRVNQILDTRWLSNMGPFERELERQIAEMVGVRNCVAMCNATVALEIAIRALRMSGEVIVPSFTFIATAHALQWQEITPVFCDIDPATHNIDPARIEGLITPRTTGIIGVHVWGRACDTDAIDKIAIRHNLKVLYDAAHAFGCGHKGQMIGGFGHAEVFSFHATKFLNSLEGGAVVTNDDALANRIRLMKNFGFTAYDRVDFVGINGKMNEISAAMGLTNLESMGDFIAVNRTNYEYYRQEFESLPGLQLVDYDPRQQNNYQYVVVEINEDAAGLSRDDLQKVLWAENVRVRRYFYPGCHRMEPYRSYFPHAGLLLPETERLASRVLVLPTGTSLNGDDVRAICGIIKLAIAHGPELRHMLKGARSNVVARG